MDPEFYRMKAEIEALKAAMAMMRASSVTPRGISGGGAGGTHYSAGPPYLVGRIIGKTQKVPGNPDSLQAYTVRIMESQSVYSNAEGIEALFKEKYPQIEANYQFYEPSLASPANKVTCIQPAFEISGNPEVPIDGSVYVQIWRAYPTGHFFFKYDPSGMQPMYAKINGSVLASGTYQHSWTKQTPTSGGTWTDDVTSPGVIQGTISPAAYPAYALDGSQVATDTIVVLWRGYGGMPRVELEELADTGRQKFRLTLSNAIGGTFTITVNGVTTSSIAYNASAATIQTALAALGVTPAFAFTVVVTGSTPGPFTIQFDNSTRTVSVNTDGLIGDLDFRFIPPGTGRVRWIKVLDPITGSDAAVSDWSYGGVLTTPKITASDLDWDDEATEYVLWNQEKHRITQTRVLAWEIEPGYWVTEQHGGITETKVYVENAEWDTVTCVMTKTRKDAYYIDGHLVKVLDHTE
jgi:hypothetical protein